MPQQVRLSRTLELLAPHARIASGTSYATALETSTAGESFVHIRAKTFATSGECRLLRPILYLMGAGGHGQALRAVTIVNAAVGGGTVQGAFISLLHGTDANTASTGAFGCRMAFGARNVSMAGKMGTIAGAQSELYADGDDSDFGQATVHSIHRFIVDGNATGKNTCKNAFEFVLTPNGQGLYTSGITNTNMTNACTEAITVVVNGNTRYIPVVTSLTT